MQPQNQPRIIPRQEHRISRKQLSPNVLRTLYRLRDHGFIAYLVGGCVRDLLLERTPKDFDIATDATPSQIKRLFRNCRLIGRRFRLAHLHFHDEILEVATFRAAAPEEETEPEELLEEPRGETGDRSAPPRHLKDWEGMVLRDNVFGTPEEDALRRDFTINALAYNIVDFSVIDYSTGLRDLEDRLIRPIGDPFVRFTEDPVRMLRAVRFAASHNFVIEPATWEVLCSLSATISRASPGRLYEEVLKLFLLGAAGPVFRLLEACGLFTVLFPGLSQWLNADKRRLVIVQSHLEGLDELFRQGAACSPSLLLAALWGCYIEAAALERHREGIPRQQALEEVCNAVREECCKRVSIPGRVSNQMRGILAMQSSLHRRPPRRPAALAARLEFADALAYLRLAGKQPENRAALAWWDDFVAQLALASSSEPSAAEVPVSDAAPLKRRRRRRRRRRSADQPAVKNQAPASEESNQ